MLDHLGQPLAGRRRYGVAVRVQDVGAAALDHGSKASGERFRLRRRHDRKEDVRRLDHLVVAGKGVESRLGSQRPGARAPAFECRDDAQASLCEAVLPTAWPMSPGDIRATVGLDISSDMSSCLPLVDVRLHPPKRPSLSFRRPPDVKRCS